MSKKAKELKPLVANVGGDSINSDKQDAKRIGGSRAEEGSSSSSSSSGPSFTPQPPNPTKSTPTLIKPSADLKGKQKADDDENDTVVTSSLEATIALEEILELPNVADDANNPIRLTRNIQAVVNKHGISASESAFGTKIIEPGKIGIINHNGKVQIVGPGRYMLLNPRAEWAMVVPLTQNPIQYETLTIVRVSKGFYGLAIEDGQPVILNEGVHVRDSRLFQHVGFQAINQKHIAHGTIHIIMVPKGEYALVTDNNIPKVLKQGRYVVNSPIFTFSGFVSVNQEHIQHNTVHIVRVAKGSIGLVTNNNRPRFIFEGTHVYNSQAFTYHGSQPLNQESIVHGTITRFRVRNGEIGLCWDDNKPVFVEKPDFYEVDSPNFSFAKVVPASTKEIVLGSKKRILVYDGEVGISYVNGKLKILQPKTHVFDASEHVFSCFLSTKQQCLRLQASNTDHYLRCDTKDFVEIGLKADVFYKIADPEVATLELGNQSAITKLISETAIATLQSIIRSSSLNEVAQSKEPTAISEQKHLESQGHGAPSAPLFFDKVHDEFISRLHDGFSKHYGIDISNIRIESFKIMDTELADNISKQAMITATTETRLANLAGQKEIATAEMERDAEVLRIKTDSQAQQLGTDTTAKAKAKLDQARAKASSTRVIAQGEADAMLIRAEAEARAIERRAEAESHRAELLAKFPLGGQMAMFELQTEMVMKAMQGVEKIIYIPTGTTHGGGSFPYGLLGMPGMPGMPGVYPVQQQQQQQQHYQQQAAPQRVVAVNTPSAAKNTPSK